MKQYTHKRERSKNIRGIRHVQKTISLRLFVEQPTFFYVVYFFLFFVLLQKMSIFFVYGVCSDLYFPVVFSFCTQLFVFYAVNFLFCFGLKEKYRKKSADRREGEAENIFQGIPPRSGVRDAKDRGKDENMIGDATKKVCASEGGVEFPKI